MSLTGLSKYFAVAISVLILGACSTVTVSTDHASIDFSGFTDYAWLNEGVTAENGKSNDIVDGRVKTIVDAQLASKNLVKVDKTAADFYVNYNITTQEKTDIKTYNSYSGYYPGYSWRGGMGPGRNYAYYDPMNNMPLQEHVITEYQEGTLIIDMIDPKTNKLIWRGTGGKRLADGMDDKERQEVVTEVVSKVLAQYPPK